MSTLKRISAALVLTLVVAMSASAGITESPPCDPGSTNSPPCASSQIPSDEPETAGQMETPRPANAEGEFSFTDLMLDVIQGALLLF